MSTISEIDHEMEQLRLRKENLIVERKSQKTASQSSRALQNSKKTKMKANKQRGGDVDGGDGGDDGDDMLGKNSVISDPRIEKMIMEGGFDKIDNSKIPERILNMSEPELMHKIKKYERKIKRILDAQEK